MGWILFTVLVLAVLGFFAKKSRERGAAASAIIAGSITLASGLITLGLSAAHLIVVLIVAFGRSPLVYDFRLYSLILLGVALAGFGLALALAAPGVVRGDAPRTRLARNSALTLILINVPLAPLQGFAVLFAVLAGVTLVVVFVHRAQEGARGVEVVTYASAFSGAPRSRLHGRPPRVSAQLRLQKAARSGVATSALSRAMRSWPISRALRTHP